MRKIAILFVIALFAYACGGGKKEKQYELKADWTRVDSILAKVTNELKMMGGDSGKFVRFDNNIRQMVNITIGEPTKEVFPLSDFMAYVPVKMKEERFGDVLVDVAVTWDTTIYQVKGKDTVWGNFRVGGFYFRQLGDSTLYELVKDPSTNFYSKQAVAPKVMQ
ncbi:hypothetical protein [Rhodoflexus caldus]|uniref:hypothetical protein n=1 Tax=Rhodoflexus caldus TaxID=2891236 RepID=UPI00202A72A5|nr:hypothetical protein [Rhodoflexus caldus]